MTEVALLSILQGVAEFLPISSSGHLVLGKSILFKGDIGMRLDIFLHVGTLLSVFIFYFAIIRRIVMKMEWQYVAKIILSAVPAGIAGILLKNHIEDMSTMYVGCALIFTGLVLSSTKLMPKGEKDVSFPVAALMGIAQAIAILPGVSRSGMTLAAARAAAIKGEKAAEFSFLMSAPPIAGAALLEVLQAMGETSEACAAQQTSWGMCILGAAIAAVVGWLALRLLVASLKGRWFWLFGPYCILAGILTICLS